MQDDDLAIRDLVARYADAVCRRDAEAWAATWAEDGVWQLPGAPRVQGRDAIVALWRNAMAGLPFVAQLVHQGVLDIDGDRATGRWYLTETLKTADGSGRHDIGVYEDRYVRTADGWRFSERHYTILHDAPTTG